jgi:pimeloyl-ACP methyl ester carboxylesterase
MQVSAVFRVRVALLVALLLFAASESAWTVAQESTPEATPAPRFTNTVEVEGRRIGLSCFGSGSPTVVLVGGLRRPSEQVWPPIADAISPMTRVCVFDRAGMGLSDPPPTSPQTAADVAADLHAALEASGEPGPYVPVGFSIGGPFVRLYASAHPEEVAGLILVDPVPPGLQARDIALPYLTEAEREVVRAAAAGRDPSVAVPIDALTSDAQVLSVPPPPPVPTVVLVRGMIDPEVPEVLLEWNSLWFELQAQQARELNARVVVAEKSGHFVPTDEPEVVIEAIREVIEATRDPSSWATPAATPAA